MPRDITFRKLLISWDNHELRVGKICRYSTFNGKKYTLRFPILFNLLIPQILQNDRMNQLLFMMHLNSLSLILIFWRALVLFVGPLAPLFWNSGDVCPGFQSQVESSRLCVGFLSYSISELIPGHVISKTDLTQVAFQISICVLS